jgi:hypothetical protein
VPSMGSLPSAPNLPVVGIASLTVPNDTSSAPAPAQ